MEGLAWCGMGCGVILAIAGVIGLIAPSLGWDATNGTVSRFLAIMGDLFGSTVIGAGLLIAVGIILTLLGLGIQEMPEWTRAARKKKATSMPSPFLFPESLPVSPVYLPDYLVLKDKKSVSVVNDIKNNLIASGFVEVPFGQDLQAYYRKDLRNSTDSYIILEKSDDPPASEGIKTFSTRIFEGVRRMKHSNTLLCYPVLVCETIPEDIQKFIQSYNPRHFAQFEFPVLVDATSGELYFFKGTPVWRAVMYAVLRDYANSLLRPFPS